MLNFAQKICNHVLAHLFNIMGLYFTYDFRPLYAASDFRQPCEMGDNSKVALVIQGQIVEWREFTLNSIILYRRWWPDVVIIVSTWEDENSAMLKRIEQAGAIIVLNRKPANSGLKNINYQITSSHAGILKAKSLCVKYAIKSRTDQRFCAPSSVPLMIESLTQFPLVGEFEQVMRVGCLSLNTFKKRIYGVSDMTIFGHINDMMRYWGCELDTRTFAIGDIPDQTDAQAYAKSRICEVYLSSRFLESLGKELLWTEEDSMNAYRDHFLVIDSEQVDLIWIKYTRRESRWRSYELSPYFDELKFAEWIRMILKSSN